MRQIDRYFDFISPYSYLASESLHCLPADVELRPWLIV
jgi:2-hydroxychromene-2-carboxylate isomerase